MFTENVTELPAHEPDTSPQAVVEGFRRLFDEPALEGITKYDLRGTGVEEAYKNIVEDAVPLAALIAGVGTKSDYIEETGVPRAAWSLQRMLGMGGSDW